MLVVPNLILALSPMGTLAVPQGPLPGSRPESARTLRMVDLDGDGRLDRLRVARDGTLRVSFQRQGRRFEDGARGMPATPVSAVLVADLDADGHLDLYLVSPEENVALGGDGVGGFVDVTRELGLADSGRGLDARLEDIDGDGALDVLLQNEDADVVFWGQPGSGFERDLEAPVAVRPVTGATLEDSADGLPIDPGTSLARASGAPDGVDSAATRGSHAAPAGSALGLGLSVACATNLRDQASGACDIQASSIPAEGMLYPLGVDLFVDAATGDVGMGTTTPSEALDVQGRVRASAGIRFGDDTLQTTAQLVGPEGPQGLPGPAGPAGPQGPPGPTEPPAQLASIGTLDLSSGPCPGGAAIAIYGLDWDVAGGAPYELVLDKDFDACSPALILMCNENTMLSDATIAIGDLTISLIDVRIEEIDIAELTDALPRERVRLSWAKATWSYSGPGGPTESNWDIATAVGNVAPGIHATPHLAWFDDDATPASAPAGAVPVLGIGLAKASPGTSSPQFADLRIVKPVDVLTTEFPYLAFAGSPLTELTADLNTAPGATYAPHLRYRLINPRVTDTSFFVSDGQLLQEVLFSYDIITWIYHPGQPDETQSYWNTVTNMGG